MTVPASEEPIEVVAVRRWAAPVADMDHGVLRAELSIEYHRRADGGFYETVDHGATLTYRSITVVWQMEESPGLLSRHVVPLPAITLRATPRVTREDFGALSYLSSRWHGQSRSVGCAHQFAEANRTNRERARSTPWCQIGDYVFGTKLLVRDIPDDVEQRARQLGQVMEAIIR